ncbi:aminotransferase class V-fold PLP-dependent enzyme [Alkalilimnicola ehrlichii]|nr:aminotransferase class V-fold PLP-dependent enzyme [Alkalilimnicola ehrlichii]
MLGIHALDASLSLFEELGMQQIEKAVLSNSQYLCELISDTPELELITNPASDRLAGIVTFRPCDHDPEPIYRQLMAAGVICAHRAGGIRFSPHFYNTKAQLKTALTAVKRYSR